MGKQMAEEAIGQLVWDALASRLSLIGQDNIIRFGGLSNF